MNSNLLDSTNLQSSARLQQKLIRLYLLLVSPALFWIGLFGFISHWRLQGEDATTYGFMSQPVAATLMGCAVLIWLLRLSRGASRWCCWAILLSAVIMLRYMVAGHGVMAGASHAFVNVATVLILLALMLCFRLRQFPNDPLFIRESPAVAWVAIVGTVISVSGAYVMIERELQQVHSHAQARAAFLRHSLQVALEEPLLAVQRMAQRWNTLETTPSPAYIAQEFLSHISGIEAIKRFTVIESSGHLGVDHQEGHQVAGLLEQAQRVMAFWAFLDRAPQQSDAVMSTPGLVTGHPQIAFVAARIGAGYPRNAWLVATIDLELLVKDAFVEDKPPCCFSVVANHVEVYRSAKDHTAPVLVRAQDQFEFEKNFTVNVDYWQERLNTEAGLSQFPWWVLLTGLVFTFFAMVSFRLAQVSSFRARLLFEQSHCDPLTGLPNRRMLEESFQRLAQQQKRTDAALGLMFIDLRGMRLINDSLGHEVADQLILALVERVRSLVPSGSILARLDGGEFVMTVPQATHEKLESLAKSLVAAISSPIVVCGRELSVSVVIGMSRSNDAWRDPMQLVRQADLAMMSAKAEGMTPWAFYDETMGEASSMKWLMSQALSTALEAGELSMLYQPLIAAHSGTMVSLEALVRWQHPNKGFISPADFIPVAEETGQIVALTDWTLHQVCRDIRAMREVGAVVPVAVNISPIYLQREDLVERIQQVLRQSGVSSELLQLEITEGLLLKNQTDVIEKIHQLRQIGIVTSLDDFGTGYSSLSYLKNLPIQKIKLDRSFVLNVTDSQPDAEIVRGVINIAHQLSLQVVVEGVETIEQAQCLARLQADQLQGYLFSKPVAFSQICGYLDDPNCFKSLLGR